jgi:HAD superfamily hydrolase (TIGR01450 family)
MRRGAPRRSAEPTIAPVPDHLPTRDLRSTLEGVRALVLDADGVLMYRNLPIPGSPEAVVQLRRLGIPYRVVTNYSSAHRSSLAAGFGKAAGIEVDQAEIITAASAAAAYTARQHAGRPLLVISTPDARREWAGQELVAIDEADARSEPVAAVVIGDVGEALTFRELDIAFRQLRAGADFVAMHRNPWWMTPKGFTLDSGAMIAGLEFALRRKAVICGKPSPVVFRQAVAELRAQLAGGPRPAGQAPGTGSGGPRLRAADVAMVGDDPKADIAAARRVGLRGVLVTTGKVTAIEAEAAGVPRSSIAPSLRAVVSAIDG